MKRDYEVPEMEIFLLTVDDIVTKSTEDDPLN